MLLIESIGGQLTAQTSTVPQKSGKPEPCETRDYGRSSTEDATIPRAVTCFECHGINTIAPVVINDAPVYTLPRQDPNRQQPKYRPAHACTECGLEKDRPVTTLARVLRCYAESQGSLRVSPQEQAEMALRLHHYWNEHYQSLPRARPPSDVLKIILKQIEAEGWNTPKSQPKVAP